MSVLRFGELDRRTERKGERGVVVEAAVVVICLASSLPLVLPLTPPPTATRPPTLLLSLRLTLVLVVAEVWLRRSQLTSPSPK